MDYSKKIYAFIVIVTIVIILIYAQGILIPFTLAGLFWVMIRVIKKGLSLIKFTGNWPRWILTIISSVILLGIVFLVVELISRNIRELTSALPAYQDNLNKIRDIINDQFNIQMSDLFNDVIKNINFSGILSQLFSTLTGIFGDAFLVLVYLIFLLIEEPIFPHKLKAMYPDQKRYDKIKETINKIDHSIINYMAIKSITSILTGFLSYFVLMIVGIDAPLFWAFLIFILNYIPTVGSLIATLFPTFFALLQFGEFTPALLIVTIVGTIQLIIGNFVEPRAMGTSLNMSPLVVILTLSLWGLIWGVTGLLLSVPITVIIIIIMSEFPETQAMAILLSQRGKINV